MFGKRQIWITTIIIVCVFLCCSCTKNNREKEVMTGYADYPSYDSVQDIADEAEYIIRGKIIDKKYEWRVISYPAVELYLNPEDVPPVEEDLVTVYTVEISDTYLSPSKATETIEVLMRGGETDTMIYRYEGTPELIVNNEYIFFLSKSSLFDNTGWPLNMEQAIYKVEGSSISKVNGGFYLTFATLENLRTQPRE